MTLNNTPDTRLQALREAKGLLSGSGSTSMFGTNGPKAPEAAPMIQLAHYIITGRDYMDREEVPEGALLMPLHPAAEPAPQPGKLANLHLIGGTGHPDDTEFITEPTEGDTYEQYEQGGLVKLAEWEFIGGTWVLRRTFTDTLRDEDDLRVAHDAEVEGPTDGE